MPRAVGIGAFDGVHLGHCAVVRSVRDAAARLGVTSAALTFEPTPRQYFNHNNHAGARLTPDPERVQLLCNLGVEQVLVQTFDDELRRMSPEAFAQTILVEGLDARFVAVGSSHTFGAGRGAGPERIRELGEELGFEVHVVPLVAVEGLSVSSTAIRTALANGDLRAAKAMLGRPYMVSGTVVKGIGAGADLGARTANLEVPAEKLLPAEGVYAARALVGTLIPGPAPEGGGEDDEGGGGIMPAAVVIGPSPTLDILETRVEVHLLDFEGDLYGAELTVALLERLRPIELFPTHAELATQIEADVQRVREVCGESGCG